MSGTQEAPQSGAEETIKDFWATKPTRPRAGRVVAGVAAGIGRRYGVDPVIVRVALVVAAVFGGSGILFYLLGWLFLPAEEDEVSAFEGMVNRGRSSVSTGFTVLLCLALIPASSFVWGGHVSTVVGAAVVLAALYLLHRGRSGQGRIVPPAARGSVPPAAEPVAPTMPTMPYGATMPTMPVDTGGFAEPPAGPPAWDPLGAAPFAWDLPDPNAEPAPEPPPPPLPRHRSMITPITLAVALIAAGGMVALGPDLHGWDTVPHILGVVLGILGIGMVGGSFVRSGRGLIGLGVLLSVIGVVATTANVTRWHGVGDGDYAPTVISAVQPDYQRTVGDVTLDLTHLSGATGTVHTTAEVTAGDVNVIVPKDAEVNAQCYTKLGDSTCLGREESGDPSTDENATQQGSGSLVIDLVATTAAGDVTVTSR